MIGASDRLDSLSLCAMVKWLLNNDFFGKVVDTGEKIGLGQAESAILVLLLKSYTNIGLYALDLYEYLEKGFHTVCFRALCSHLAILSLIQNRNRKPKPSRVAANFSIYLIFFQKPPLH